MTSDKNLLARFPRHWHSLGQIRAALQLPEMELQDFLQRNVEARKVEARTFPTVAWRLRK